MEYNYSYASNESPKNNNHSKNSFNLPNFKAIIIFLIGWLGITIVATVVQSIGLLFVKDPQNITSVEELNLVCFVNFISYIITLIVLLVLLGWNNIKVLLKQFANFKNIGKGIIYGGLLLLLTFLYNLIVLTFYPEYGANENQTIIEEMVHTYPILLFFDIVIIAPIFEEITYRLCLTGTIAKKSKILAIVASSLLFGFIHSAFSSFSFVEMNTSEIINELIALPSYIISGFVLALAYVKEDSLSVGITAHALNNLIGFIGIVTEK